MLFSVTMHVLKKKTITQAVHYIRSMFLACSLPLLHTLNYAMKVNSYGTRPCLLANHRPLYKATIQNHNAMPCHEAQRSASEIFMHTSFNFVASSGQIGNVSDVMPHLGLHVFDQLDNVQVHKDVLEGEICRVIDNDRLFRLQASFHRFLIART